MKTETHLKAEIKRLQQSVEAQARELESKNRELEIQNSLDIVRARTMAMHRSDELTEASIILEEEVRKLGIQSWGCAFHIYDETATESIPWDLEWFTSAGGMLPFYKTPREYVFLKYYEESKKGKQLFIQEIGPEVIEQHYDYLKTLPVLGKALKDLHDSGVPLPERQIDHVAFFKHGHLLFITYEPVPDAHDIFIRFAKVFDQTYTRFLELQKAEAQAREAQIEAALERVRAKAMALHSSEMVGEAINNLFEELEKLGFESFVNGLNIIHPDCKMESWSAAVRNDIERVFIAGGIIDMNHHPGTRKLFDDWKQQKKTHITHIQGPEVEAFFQSIYAQDTFKAPFYLTSFPDELYLNNVIIPEGSLWVMTEKELTKDYFQILSRFAQVFSLTYTRYKDLQKAESQAREAQIEVALEKIRNRTLLMKDSAELNETVSVFFQQFDLLELLPKGARTYFSQVDTKTDIVEVWMTHADGRVMSGSHLTPLNQSAHLKAFYTKWKKDRGIINIRIYQKEDLANYMAFLATLPHVAQDEDYQKLFKSPHDQIVMTDAGFLQGFLGIMSFEPLKKEAIEILSRFAKAFEFTYTRFLDLQKAEAQAKEAKIELSLERIRAQVTAMRESDELLEIVVNMRKEFVSLGHEAHYFWHMRWLPETYSKAMTSGDGTQIGMVMSLPRHIHGDIPPVAAWEKGGEPTHILAMDVDLAVEYVDKMIKLGDFERVDPQAPTLDDIRHIGGLTFVMARTTHGEIGYSLPGKVEHPPQESIDTLTRFAGVFDLAYKRFEDLKKAEANALKAEKDLIAIKEAKKKAENALKELKAAQQQLVQQEKLASLGQLTAGIAHEIKNPLNFVNNFSELSVELIEEVFEELVNLEDSDTKEEIRAILEDVKNNLSKVHEHGKRADGIVKSMLQHSRASNNKMEPKAINPFIKEFVNLAFHGMRAAKNPINVTIDLQLDEQVGELNIISEDFSRVILNLCNNAFDAMREKLNSPDFINYKPKLTVVTKASKSKIQIEIIDNGSGIPKEIQDKVLQPFFTTKKGTEGTGLGLSISHDIVKAHGGEIKIESEEGKGTTFFIQLPLN